MDYNFWITVKKGLITLLMGCIATFCVGAADLLSANTSTMQNTTNGIVITLIIAALKMIANYTKHKQ